MFYLKICEYKNRAGPNPLFMAILLGDLMDVPMGKWPNKIEVLSDVSYGLAGKSSIWQLFGDSTRGIVLYGETMSETLIGSFILQLYCK